MKKILLLTTICIALLTAIISPAVLVLAIDDPDDPPQIDSVYVYEDLLEDGDIGVFCNYYIDYDIAGTPDELVTDSYLIIFVDTDGATQLKAIAPYAFDNNGYYRGMAWIYFTADEVDTYSLTSANEVLYEIWITGNPTVPSGWVGDPPKTEVGISDWYTTGDSSLQLAQQVINYGAVLESDPLWSATYDIIEPTVLGNRLTSSGEAYFTNVIANLRIMAPNCFADTTLYPAQEDIDYSISFGATATSGTSIVTGSPVTLVAGNNTITVNGNGTFTLDLEAGTYGTITNDTTTVASSPSDLVPGENVITVTGGAGDVTVNVGLASTQETITGAVEGTGFDLTAVATAFGMSRLVFSGLVWMLATIVLCGGAYYATRSVGDVSMGRATNVTMLVFVLSLIGGALMGMLDLRVTALLAIGYGAFIGYMLFYRTSSDIGRTVMFMGWMWFVTCLVGGLLVGSVPQTTTVLTTDISAADTTITVRSTVGFNDAGILVIEDERIAYHHTTDTTFTGTFWRPLARGTQDTEAAAHASGVAVRSTESALLNDTLNYNIALLSDSSGIMAFVSLPLVFWDLLTSFLFLPISFLGTDMVILTYVWALFGLGLIVSIFIAIIGGRRV